MDYIKGVFLKSIFSSDSGYTIGILKLKETNDKSVEDYINKSLTFTGYFSDLVVGEMYILYGKKIEHPKYGIQYEVSNYEKIKPEDIDGIINFLSSNLFPGIGEKLATSIVNTLGKDTINKILENKECLNLVPNLSLKKQELLYNNLKKDEGNHKTVVYLTNLGFTIREATIIYNIYKDHTIMRIENNIYDILDETKEISFLKIDEVAYNNNLYQDINRIKACIIYIINSLTFQTGNTYLTKEEIKNYLYKYLKQDLTDDLFDDFLNELYLEEKIVIENDKYYSLEIYNSENVIISKFKRMFTYKNKEYKNIDKEIINIQKNNKINYNQKQIDAIKNALENRITIITGGPGTGKTTIVKAIVSLYKKLNKLDDTESSKLISLLAPTGRASKRLSENAQMLASTIHRFLKWNKDNNEFGINEYNKDFSKFIVIDESSMIDINLLSSLLRGLLDDIQIVFVGDYNQLPSVGPGMVLRDMIESETIQTIKLDILYRQNNDSYIPILASEIKDDNISDFLTNHDDYTFLKCSSNSIINNLSSLCLTIISKGYTYKNFQIIAPTYIGLNGIDNLNKNLQEIFNPKDKSKNEYKSGDIIYRENDKILQLVNSPEDNVFNGDVGFIDKIVPATISESKKVEIYVNYDGNVVKYLPKDLINIKHGFVISIHKSQGSEFDVVIMPLCLSYNRMLYKKLIYTGVTRAKKKLILLGDPNAFLTGVSKVNEIRRKTMLKEKLKNLYKKIDNG